MSLCMWQKIAKNSSRLIQLDLSVTLYRLISDIVVALCRLLKSLTVIKSGTVTIVWSGANDSEAELVKLIM
eukprot:Pgem_evm1s13073